MKNEEGFTLIEILVAAALMVLVAAGFLGLQYIFTQNQLTAWQTYLSIEEGNNTLATMAREIRTASPSETGSYPLLVANDQEIVFFSDYDYDGTVERIRYTLTGSDLEKGVVEPTSTPTYPLDTEKTRTVTSNIRNGSDPVFFYYNEDWPGDTTNNPLTLSDRISQTELVTITLDLNTDDSDPNNNYTVESNTQIRMLRAEE